MPYELFNECKCEHSNYKLTVETFKSKNFKIFVKNYQKIVDSRESAAERDSSHLFINHTNFNLKITLNKEKIQIENVKNKDEFNFKKYLIFIYEKNHYELVIDEREDEQLKSNSNDQIIELKIKNKIKE